MFHFIKITMIGLVAILTMSLTVGTAWAQEDENAAKVKVSKKTTDSVKKKAKNKGDSTNVILSNVSGGNSGFRYQGAITHIPRLRNDQEDTTNILTRVDYTFNRNHRVRIQQSFTKLYQVNRNENEYQPTDTTLAHYLTLPKLLGASLQWRTAAVVPISNNSVRDDLVTRFTGSLIAIKPFLKGKLLGIFVPYGRYHWYEYKTSQSGRALPWYTLGASATGVYFITRKLTFAPTVNFNYEGRTFSQFEQDPVQQDNGIYSFDLDLSYQITRNITASLGYSQGASFFQDGRYELVFYDNENSRYTFGLNAIF